MVDEAGNAYATDSFAGILYKIDAVTGLASVFLTDPRLLGNASSSYFGANGIEYRNRNLIVGNSVGALLRISIDTQEVNLISPVMIRSHQFNVLRYLVLMEFILQMITL